MIRTITKSFVCCIQDNYAIFGTDSVFFFSPETDCKNLKKTNLTHKNINPRTDLNKSRLHLNRK